MTRYIDADKFKSNLEKAVENMHLIGGVKGVDVGAVIKALDMQPTADVVPKSEVERLRANLEAVLEEIPETKSEVAREIFEEIDILVEDWKHSRIQSIQFIAELAELKKKYTNK